MFYELCWPPLHTPEMAIHKNTHFIQIPQWCCFVLSSEVFQVSSVRFTQPPPSPSLLFPAVFLSGLSRQLFKYNPGNKKEGKTPPPATTARPKQAKHCCLHLRRTLRGTQTTNKQTNKSLNSTKSSSQLLQLQPIYNIIHTVDKYCSIFHCRMDFTTRLHAFNWALRDIFPSQGVLMLSIQNQNKSHSVIQNSLVIQLCSWWRGILKIPVFHRRQSYNLTFD